MTASYTTEEKTNVIALNLESHFQVNNTVDFDTERKVYDPDTIN